MTSRKTRSRRKPDGRSKGTDRTARLGLIGLDVGSAVPRISARRLLPLLVVGLVVALGVASLRIELLRVRYALGDATLEEQRLRAEVRSLTAKRRALRDPSHLAERADQLGFVHPQNLIDLPDAPASARTPVLAAGGPAATGAARP